MLSIHPDLRNWIGQRFVEARILYQGVFERVFPGGNRPSQGSSENGESDLEREAKQHSKQWAHRLTKAAKDDLFNMFHNKSDDFLAAVGAGRIEIVGPPVDEDFLVVQDFDGVETIDVAPDLIVPAVGYRSRLEELTNGLVKLAEFYLGCTHAKFDNLFLVGFARPIIGNVPTISEVQAQFVSGLIAGEYPRETDIAQFNQSDTNERCRRYRKLNLDAVYPVEMFPYCDRLAKQMETDPSLWRLKSLVKWIRLQLAPASTMHYQHQDSTARECYEPAAIFMPSVLILLLLMLKPLSWIYSGCNSAIRTIWR
jgi:dimethylaniline monooxygenase (N-oxide forming)